jgi:hemerythrin
MGLHWQDGRYGTGVQTIDSRHKELFSRVDSFIKASETDSRRAELERMLDFLGQYASDFPAEEALMEQRSCPARDENKEDHRWFTTEIGALKVRFQHEGVSEPLRECLMAMVVQWFEAHIARVDARLRETAN